MEGEEKAEGLFVGQFVSHLTPFSTKPVKQVEQVCEEGHVAQPKEQFPAL